MLVLIYVPQFVLHVETHGGLESPSCLSRKISFCPEPLFFVHRIFFTRRVFFFHEFQVSHLCSLLNSSLRTNVLIFVLNVDSVII